MINSITLLLSLKGQDFLFERPLRESISVDDVLIFLLEWVVPVFADQKTYFLLKRFHQKITQQHFLEKVSKVMLLLRLKLKLENEITDCKNIIIVAS